MPTWQAIAIFCFALATTMYFKFYLPEADRDAAFGEPESRMARLERYRMEHGTCVRCGEPLPHGGTPHMPAAPVCVQCGRVSCG